MQPHDRTVTLFAEKPKRPRVDPAGNLEGNARARKIVSERGAMSAPPDQFLDLSTSLFAPIQGIIARSLAPVSSIGCAPCSFRLAFISG